MDLTQKQTKTSDTKHQRFLHCTMIFCYLYCLWIVIKGEIVNQEEKKDVNGWFPENYWYNY